MWAYRAEDLVPVASIPLSSFLEQSLKSLCLLDRNGILRMVRWGAGRDAFLVAFVFLIDWFLVSWADEAIMMETSLVLRAPVQGELVGLVLLLGSML